MHRACNICQPGAVAAAEVRPSWMAATATTSSSESYAYTISIQRRGPRMKLRRREPARPRGRRARRPRRSCRGARSRGADPGRPRPAPSRGVTGRSCPVDVRSLGRPPQLLGVRLVERHVHAARLRFLAHARTVAGYDTPCTRRQQRGLTRGCHPSAAPCGSTLGPRWCRRRTARSIRTFRHV